MYKLYHNNDCSKSRKCLAILNEKNISFEIIEYMKNDLTKKNFQHILEYIAHKHGEIIRVDNKKFKENPFDLSNKDKIISFLRKHPSCMQRPIFFDGKKYYICRPPEKIFTII